MSKKQTRPFIEAKREFIDTLEAYSQAANMLHTAVATALTMDGIPEQIRTLLQEKADAFERSLIGPLV